jgi:hypothetical protein
MSATWAGLIIGLVLGIGIGRLYERARRPAGGGNDAPGPKPFEEFKKAAAKFIVAAVIVLVLIAIGRRHN